MTLEEMQDNLKTLSDDDLYKLRNNIGKLQAIRKAIFFEKLPPFVKVACGRVISEVTRERACELISAGTHTLAA